MSRLIQDSYGKSDVRIMKVTHSPEGDRVMEFSVDIRLEGDFTEGYTEGDNTKVLPTDTMKNTVYALGRKHDFDTAEEFALILAEHFVANHGPADQAYVAVAERPWESMEVGGEPHGQAFVQSTGERRVAYVEHDGEETILEGGLSDLVILKSTNSGFSDFSRDDYTTLQDAEDRVLATSLEASWRFEDLGHDYLSVYLGVRDTLLEVFAEHQSLSVQHTLYAMGEAVLERYSEIESIHLQMPNQHNLPVDLSAFGMDNPHEILMPIDEPSGFIEGTLTRD